MVTMSSKLTLQQFQTLTPARQSQITVNDQADRNNSSALIAKHMPDNPGLNAEEDQASGLNGTITLSLGGGGRQPLAKQDDTLASQMYSTQNMNQ